MINIYQIFGKVLLNHKVSWHHKWSLLVLSGNEQDLARENIVNTYLFYQEYKMHDIVLETSLPMQGSHDTLVSAFLPKIGVLEGNCIITK